MTTAVSIGQNGSETSGILSQDTAFRLHCFNRDWFALSMLKYRDFQGYLVTGPHSGTHWVKWMMSHAMAHHYGLEPPQYFNNASASANEFIAHPKLPRKYPQLPRIATSHSVAPNVLQWKWARNLLGIPPYAVVIRDIRSVLISNYEKWKHKYNVSFSEYLKGDPWSDRFICDAWSYIRLMNRWGEVANRFPEETLVVRYEDFQSNAAGSLEKLGRHFKLPLAAADFDAGAAAGSKEFMAKHQDPAIAAQPLRPDGKGDTVFSDADKAFLQNMLDRHLKHDFGYDLLPAQRGFSCKAQG